MALEAIVGLISGTAPWDGLEHKYSQMMPSSDTVSEVQEDLPINWEDLWQRLRQLPRSPCDELGGCGRGRPQFCDLNAKTNLAQPIMSEGKKPSSLAPE
jgi:hypothetical protein